MHFTQPLLVVFLLSALTLAAPRGVGKWSSDACVFLDDDGYVGES